MDTEFVKQFIAQCATDGITTSEHICELANKNICSIDREIFELKQKQEQLIDVLKTFGVTVKREKINTEYTANKVDRQLATEIASMLGNRKVQLGEMSSFLGKFPSDHRKELIFNLKCMVENKILHRDDKGYISEGEKYNEYFGLGASVMDNGQSASKAV